MSRQQLHGDNAAPLSRGDGALSVGREQRDSTPRGPKTSREVYFALLPARYDPLEEEVEEQVEEEERRRKDEKRRKKKEKYKRYRKNLRAALRFTWRCLVAGLQSLATPCVTPHSVVTAVVVDAAR